MKSVMNERQMRTNRKPFGRSDERIGSYGAKDGELEAALAYRLVEVFEPVSEHTFH